MTQLLFFILFTLACINWARLRRDKCDWTRSQALRQAWLAGVMIAAVQILFAIWPPPPLSLVGLLLSVVFYYSVYTLAKAMYRRADLKKAAQNPDAQTAGTGGA